MTGPPREPLPEHPTGTLVLVLVYGAVFALGWLAFYFCLFLARGPVS
jgi:hypothetical protein